MTFSLKITGVQPDGAKISQDDHSCTVIVADDKNYKLLVEEVIFDPL